VTCINLNQIKSAGRWVGVVVGGEGEIHFSRSTLGWKGV
jgi:hypothetical protein